MAAGSMWQHLWQGPANAGAGQRRLRAAQPGRSCALALVLCTLLLQPGLRAAPQGSGLGGKAGQGSEQPAWQQASLDEAAWSAEQQFLRHTRQLQEGDQEDPERADAGQIAWEGGILPPPSLSLNETLTFLETFFRDVEPVLPEIKWTWAEAQHPAAKEALEAAGQLYRLYIVYWANGGPAAPCMDHHREKVKQEEDQFSLSEMLGKLIHAVDRCRQAVCNTAIHPVNIQLRTMQEAAGGKPGGRNGGGSGGAKVTPAGIAFPTTRRVVLSLLHALDMLLAKRQSVEGCPVGLELGPHAGSGGVRKAGAAPGGGALISTDECEMMTPEEAGKPEARKLAWTGLRAIRAAGRTAIMKFHQAEVCSRVLRPATEVLHISKSGGTSMCELARLAGHKNPGMNVKDNCLVHPLGLFPRWLHWLPDVVPTQCKNMRHWLVPKPSACEEWASKENITCDYITKYVNSRGYTIFFNEVALHGSSATNPAASHMCQQLRSMVVLRDPMDRIASHLQHVEVVLQQQMQPRCPSAKVEDPWTIPRELRYWADFAPAIFDNTILRHLLGRHAQCKRIRGRSGMFSPIEIAHGKAKLLAVDMVLVLPKSQALEYDEVETTMRLGLGWPYTLGDVAFRKAKIQHGIEEDMGFPPGTEMQLIELNKHDLELFGLGCILFKLDAAYYATGAYVRQMAHRHRVGLATGSSGNGGPASATAAGTGAGVMGSGRSAMGGPDSQDDGANASSGGSGSNGSGSGTATSSDGAASDDNHVDENGEEMEVRQPDLNHMTFLASAKISSKERPGPLKVLPELLLFGTACHAQPGDVFQ